MTAKDLYMNFLSLRLTTGAAADTLVESTPLPTNLTVRGALAYLIHQVQFHIEGMDPTTSVSNVLAVALSTKKGLAVLPTLDDAGLVSIFERQAFLNVNGAYAIDQPYVQTFLPPFPIAAPSLSLYAQGNADSLGMRSKVVRCRIGFTTVPLDAAMYTELVEAWGYQA